MNNRLRELREDNDLTQLECSKIANVSKQSYIRYENNERIPTIDVLIKLADYYHVSIDYIYKREITQSNIYISNENGKTLYNNYLQLNDINKIKANSYILGLLANQ